MKKILFSIFSLIFLVALSAQSQSDTEVMAAKNDFEGKKVDLASLEISDTAKWEWGGFGTLNFGQAAFVNWAAGGTNSITVGLLGNLYANYTKKRHRWETSFNGEWGIQKFKGQAAQKNVDWLELNTKYGYKFSKAWFATGLLNFRSQFSKSYNYTDSGRVEPHISRFLAPGYLLTGVGIDYIPNKYFSLFVSPATGKFTFVLDDTVDETAFGLDAGQNVRMEFGAYLRAQAQYEIFKNVNVRTTLEVFNNYTDPNKPNRKNFDINWLTGVEMKVNKWLLATLTTQLIYDQDTEVDVDRDEDGVIDGKGPRTQFREAFTLGLTYTFKNK